MEQDREILLVSVFTFFTVLLWIFFELVKTVKTSTVAPTVRYVITPLTAKIDTNILDSLEKRVNYSP
ncbi:hypothetical protein HY409_02170 [Candidatus Gottesmanbacteria bacterium]|nr:hypothetical protein [Candidatus Gottesmanbacteria bacterium]